MNIVNGDFTAAAVNGDGDVFLKTSDFGFGPEPATDPLFVIPAFELTLDTNLTALPENYAFGHVHSPVSYGTVFSELGVDGLWAVNDEIPAAQVILNAGGENLVNTYVSPESLPLVLTLPNGSDPVQVLYAGSPGVGAVGVAVAPGVPAAQVFAGPTGNETMLNTVVSANSSPVVITLPDGSSPVQLVYLGAPDVGYVGAAFNQAAGPGDPMFQVFAGPDGEAPLINQVINQPGLPSGSSSSSSSSGNDTLSFGSGSDSVVALGNATAAGLSGVTANLGADSIISTVTDAVGTDAFGGSDAFSAQSSSSAFALGADSLAAAQLVTDFASAPAAAPVVTTVEEGASAAGSLVSLDDGLTTIDVSGVTSKLPFGG